MMGARVSGRGLSRALYSANASSHWLLLAPVVLFLAVFAVLPLLKVVQFSLTDPELSLDNYVHVFSSGFYLKTMLGTFMTAFMVAALCLLLAYPVAYVAARAGGWVAVLLLLAVAMSFWTSFLVRTYAWMVILGSQGPVVALLKTLGFQSPQLLFTNFSAVMAMVHIMLPFMVMALYAVMSKIDPNLLRAATSLGARPFQAFRTVFLPLSAPGIVTGFSFVFIICLGFYVTPVLLGSPRSQMIAGVIGDHIEYSLAWGEASAIAIVLLVITLALFAIYNRYVGLDKMWG